MSKIKPMKGTALNALNTVLRDFCKDDRRIVLIRGEAGMGKTSFARPIAERWRSRRRVNDALEPKRDSGPRPMIDTMKDGLAPTQVVVAIIGEQTIVGPESGTLDHVSASVDSTATSCSQESSSGGEGGGGDSSDDESGGDDEDEPPTNRFSFLLNLEWWQFSLIVAIIVTALLAIYLVINCRPSWQFIPALLGTFAGSFGICLYLNPLYWFRRLTLLSLTALIGANVCGGLDFKIPVWWSSDPFTWDTDSPHWSFNLAMVACVLFFGACEAIRLLLRHQRKTRK